MRELKTKEMSLVSGGLLNTGIGVMNVGGVGGQGGQGGTGGAGGNANGQTGGYNLIGAIVIG